MALQGVNFTPSSSGLWSGCLLKRTSTCPPMNFWSNCFNYSCQGLGNFFFSVLFFSFPFCFFFCISCCSPSSRVRFSFSSLRFCASSSCFLGASSHETASVLLQHWYLRGSGGTRPNFLLAFLVAQPHVVVPGNTFGWSRAGARLRLARESWWLFFVCEWNGPKVLKWRQMAPNGKKQQVHSSRFK